MVSLGSGTRLVVGGQLEELMGRQVALFPNWNLPYTQQGVLSLEDVDYLKESIIGAEEVAPFYRGWFRINYEGREYTGSVAGVVENALELTNLKLEYGRMITESDLANHEHVAVIGQRTLEQLTDNTDFASFIGKEIEIDGNRLLIVGVLGIANASVVLSNDVVLVPLTTFRDLWRWYDPYNFLITYDSKSTEEDIINQIEYLMNDKYGTSRGQCKFMPAGIQKEINIYNNILKILILVLGSIAGISLLVGGIGVMNIMLVNVKERTKEIGLRKAIGASSRDIQSQFLIESILLAGGGGIIGIIIGAGFSSLLNFIIAHFFEWWQGYIPAWVILLSFGVTTFIGIVFGSYPAYKASKLDPIEALRYE
jgi:ABC-type antimicrobial peptide transport system permease subunit